MKTLAAAGIAAIFAAPLAASGGQEGAVKSQVIEYRHGETVLEGYLAWDPAVQGRRPAVIVVHEWKGHGPYVRRRADQLARLGYLAFAIDMYGKGVLAKDHEEAGKLAGAFFKDRKLMRDRSAAALEVLKKHDLCDAKRIAAMGYCFGGTTALEMARAGGDLRGVASFHGKLDAIHEGNVIPPIKAKVIVFHGQADGFIPEKEIADFHQEMKIAKADYQFVSFGGAVHSFTVREAGDDPSKGMAYNERADKRSWEMLKDFLKEVFE